MTIAVIGTGNVGGALAEVWAGKGHTILLGVRNVQAFKGKDLLQHPNIRALLIPDAVRQAEMVLVAATPEAIPSIASGMGDVSGKVIIDAMNSVRSKPDGFRDTFEALKRLTTGAEIVKCFNSTGFENMKDPMYPDGPVDMFMAGDSKRGKEVASRLAKDAGFAACHDFGGDAQVPLLEQFALVWINLAIMQGKGRNIAFKILTRQRTT